MRFNLGIKITSRNENLYCVCLAKAWLPFSCNSSAIAGDGRFITIQLYETHCSIVVILSLMIADKLQLYTLRLLSHGQIFIHKFLILSFSDMLNCAWATAQERLECIADNNQTLLYEQELEKRILTTCLVHTVYQNPTCMLASAVGVIN